MKDILYVLTRENEINKIRNNKNICFSLCPLVVNNSELKIIYPNPLKTSKLASKQILESNTLFNLVIDLVKKSIDAKERELIKEILMPYLEMKISIFIYLRSVLPKFKTYKLFIGGKWQNFYNLNSLIIAIENKYSKKEGNIHNHLNKFTKDKYNLTKKLLSNLQVHLISKIIQKKSTYLLSNNKSYFMPSIFNELKKRGKNIIVYNQSQNYIDILYILLRQLLTIFFNKKIFINEFFLIPTLKKIKIYLNDNIDKNEYKDNEYIKYLVKDVEKYINVYRGYQHYTYRLFKDLKKNQISGIFHTNRFPDLNSLSLNLSNLNQKQHLISHGTHTLQKLDDSDLLASENQAIGMIESNIPKVNIYSQSIFSDDYLSSKNIRFKKIKPLNVKINNNFKDINKFNILCAGTVKQLGARRYYFESSFEYIYCIIELANKLRKLDFEIQLTIRIRDVNYEINSRIKMLLAEKFQDLIRISQTKNISDDILKSDCLIALSSTTLEDAIKHNLPSMSYGMSKYDHFSFYKNSEYGIKENLVNYDKLRKIEKLLNKNFIYLNDILLARKKDIYDFII